MLIIETDGEGNRTFRHVEDAPERYNSKEWKAYSQACEEAEASGEQWTDKQAETFTTYEKAARENTTTPWWKFW